MQRIGIFGGSFNPIHLGHLAVARKVIEQGLVDEVWLMVSPQNPLKQAATDLIPEQDRLALARQAVEDCPRILASDFEMQLPLPSYTWRTMEALRERYPNYAFSLIIGADNWVNFSRWAHHEALLAEYPLLVYPREGYPIASETLPSSVHIIDAPLFPFSSTSIRNLLADGKDVEKMIPACIIDAAQRLYAAPL
jgi:nicotinate-nucleotide adenylyltransferase